MPDELNSTCDLQHSILGPEGAMGVRYLNRVTKRGYTQDRISARALEHDRNAGREYGVENCPAEETPNTKEGPESSADVEPLGAVRARHARRVIDVPNVMAQEHPILRLRPGYCPNAWPFRPKKSIAR